jgi:transcriptional regulator with XRE-family HTH domain
LVIVTATQSIGIDGLKSTRAKQSSESSRVLPDKNVTRAAATEAAATPTTVQSFVDESDPMRTDQEVDEQLWMTRVSEAIAGHVRGRRQEIGLTLDQLAGRTGISKGMLSRIENAKRAPSLATIKRLSFALDLPVNSLFRNLGEERDVVLIKADSRPEIPSKGNLVGRTDELLGILPGHKRVETHLVSFSEGTDVLQLVTHAGVEILYMLEGTMEYSYGQANYTVEKGDTLQFEGDIPHGPAKLITLPVRFLSIAIYGGGRG